MSFCGTDAFRKQMALIDNYSRQCIIYRLRWLVTVSTLRRRGPSVYRDLGRSKGLWSQGKQFLASSRKQVSIATGQNITNIITTKLTWLTQFFIFECNQLINLRQRQKCQYIFIQLNDIAWAPYSCLQGPVHWAQAKKTN